MVVVATYNFPCTDRPAICNREAHGRGYSLSVMLFKVQGQCPPWAVQNMLVMPVVSCGCLYSGGYPGNLQGVQVLVTLRLKARKASRGQAQNKVCTRGMFTETTCYVHGDHQAEGRGSRYPSTADSKPQMVLPVCLYPRCKQNSYGHD